MEDPIDQPELGIRKKTEKLQQRQKDITNGKDLLQHWQIVPREYQEVTTAALPTQTLVPVDHTASGVACPECGLYFISTKTLRQHRALRHKVMVEVDPTEAQHYQPHEHSIGGMPPCRSCKKPSNRGARSNSMCSHMRAGHDSCRRSVPQLRRRSGSHEGEPNPAPSNHDNHDAPEDGADPRPNQKISSQVPTDSTHAENELVSSEVAPKMPLLVSDTRITPVPFNIPRFHLLP